jgi:hypothetical protein
MKDVLYRPLATSVGVNQVDPSTFPIVDRSWGTV